MSVEMESLVRVEGVSHTFPAPEGGKDVLALNAIDMEIRRGEMVAFIGPSGCGKSTLLNVIGGMKQRVALARALSLRTDILLMDEPFAALDEQTRMIFGEDLSRLLATERKTIILVTHSLAEAVLLCDRIFVFTSRPGRIKAVLTIDEPHPRTPAFMTSQRFSELRNELYELLRDEVLAAIGNDRQGLS